jgi:hypothetical protein
MPRLIQITASIAPGTVPIFPAISDIPAVVSGAVRGVLPLPTGAPRTEHHSAAQYSIARKYLTAIRWQLVGAVALASPLNGKV